MPLCAFSNVCVQVPEALSHTCAQQFARDHERGVLAGQVSGDINCGGRPSTSLLLRSPRLCARKQ